MQDSYVEKLIKRTKLTLRVGYWVAGLQFGAASVYAIMHDPFMMLLHFFLMAWMIQSVLSLGNSLRNMKESHARFKKAERRLGESFMDEAAEVVKH